MIATRIDRGSTDTTTIYSEGGDLVFERAFDAPLELVWQAFTDPATVPLWWGQRGSSTTVEEMDVRVGGAWRYRSSKAGRDDVTFFGEYLEIDPPRDTGGRSCSRSMGWVSRVGPSRSCSRRSTDARR